MRRGAGGQAGRGQGAWTSKEEEKGQSQGRGGLWELRVSVPGAEGMSTCGVRLPNDVLSQPCEISQEQYLEEQRTLRNCVMIILHVFLRIGALLQTPRPDPEEYDWDHESMDLGTPGQSQA